MSGFMIRRLIQALLVLLTMSALVFVAVFAIGDPLALLVDPQADRHDIARVRAGLGLDQPWWVQYARFVGAMAHGDLGRSFVHGEPAIRLVLERMPATLELAVAALLIALLVGVPLGLWVGLQPRSWSARLIDALSLLGFSLPTFWVGMMFIMLFGVWLGWLPTGGRGETTLWLGIPLSIGSLDGWRHLLLPALTLALFKCSLLLRLTASATREALRQDYVRFARARGLHPARIVFVHVFKNILIPIVTVSGLEFGSLIAFAVVTETVFAWPGMGKLLIEAIGQLDRPVVVAYLLVTVTLFVTINLVVDLLYALLDPRVRLRSRP
ncbi:ABC transporter permease [Jeongeupia naejangsanensis]|uniref:ABC transporter permease n=1 Tax=Jeongeupia naejangsanensis TaxID=613195 RepID=A0ABS2BH07_9NEIS|nr:ABC transporter permease [Jeongeupia naejangsanensis]MBM3114899.1 ABC transporter permease [Jeongeupia naejangsanensis]